MEGLKVVNMAFQRSQLSLLGLIIALAGCSGQVTVESSPATVASSPASPGEAIAGKPFRDLLTDTAANPPQLIPELSSVPPAGLNSTGTSAQDALPSVRVSATERSLPPVPPTLDSALLPVPVPPAPRVVRTVPLPTSVQPIAAAPARSSAPVATAPAQSAPVPARSPAPVPARQPAQSQAVAVRPSPQAIPNRLAESVVVTGVVQVGDTVSAIVQVPNEQSSRYVRAGEYLANGRILVNRIEMTADGEPRVVLVQDGVETVRTVGNL
ncbi:hypothetical protein H6G89_11165 [Oscillatoria sp. FACHB-1407]|nr:hypothetical protein [Oscillatoria sp. FACHB-1407]MBD2461610.1 hypothetical protein [Oscillatoria sp. FACHB-1407]